MNQTGRKSFDIPKDLVWEAYEHIKSNGGTYGIDEVSLAAFDRNLKNNLYKIWNRMSSGSYHPPAVRRSFIPKASGGERPLGIPTVADRIAQMVVKLLFEPVLEPIFHQWSFAYRPGRSALDAVGLCRENCWKLDWAVDMDIQGFFDAIDHDLLLKAVRKHAPERWHVLYIERWLRAPVAHSDGRIESRERGTPQGGVISPLLANLFLHYVFDEWMSREHPITPFERYADDAICHCRTRAQAEALLGHLRERFASCGLTLHPEKTKIVYCRDGDRQKEWEPTRFTFLGYEFRQRTMANRYGERFQGFSPAMSPQAVKATREKIFSLTDRSQTHRPLRSVILDLNQLLRGVWAYHGAYFASEVSRRIGWYVDRRLVHWARRKYKRINRSWRKGFTWLKRLRRRDPYILYSWRRA